MKTHKTIQITEAFLNDLEPCPRGHDLIVHLLPATISTDVDANIKLACEIVEAHAADLNDDVFWLWLAVQDGNVDGTYPDMDSSYSTAEDVWVTAQYLAWVADYLLSKIEK